MVTETLVMETWYVGARDQNGMGMSPWAWNLHGPPEGRSIVHWVPEDWLSATESLPRCFSLFAELECREFEKGFRKESTFPSENSL